MGIPSFYRWLVNRYPSIVSPAKESRPADGIVVYDNLYLDMNQIIHYSFHPQDQMNAGTDVCAPTTVSEVFESMFDYLDRLFRIVRPRRLLYLAVGSSYIYSRWIVGSILSSNYLVPYCRFKN
ncbi:hypothetical protein EE612_011358 [Oryza sativa]|jgi:5'-3' exonuclease|nr:hypothetical protein EE612_011358 [Oryza sativa]